MSSDGLRIGLLLIGIGALLGCASVPPVPANAQNQASSDEDPYDGWLFKSLSGRRNATASSQANPPTNPATATNSPTAPVATGPLIPGPSSHPNQPSPTGVIQASAEAPIAGPPPTIPQELPAPAPGAISIKDMQAKEKEEADSGFELADLAPENIYKNLKKAAGYGPDEKIARANMEEGKQLFEAKKYKEAAAKFATAAARWPDSPLEEDALFLQGESQFFADQYPQAHDTFGGLLKKYSNTRHLDTVVAREFAMGRYWEQLYDKDPKWPITPNLTDGSRPRFDTFGYAIQAFERVRLNDPTGPLADDSLMASANAYFRRGQYENAAYDYDLLRKEYPNSEHQALAHVLGLQAKMRVYQGAMYVAEPLNEAKQIADRTLSRFSDKLGDEQERVAQARAQIIEEQANREYMLGEYYANRRYYGAARMYYKNVIEKFPTTGKAKDAQKRLEEIRNEPDEPPNRFGWLTGMFESKKR